MPRLNIVMVEPEIPQNTGNVARTCAATGAALHLIRPLGFEIDDRKLKRAGLDYWDKLDVTVYSDYQDFLKKNPGAKIYMATTKGEHVYTDVPYDPDAYIMFGPESRGIPEELLIRQTGNLKQSFNLTFGPHNALSTQAVRVESVSDSKEVKNSIAVIL